MQLKSVGKRYGRNPWVFTDVTMELEPGQVVAISGANGCGKSTLLNLIIGAIRPSTGTISKRPRSIGYVPENFPAHQRMSALDYLTHMGRIRGLSTTESNQKANDLLDRFALVGGRTTPLSELSKGNRQKVGLIQSLLRTPELLVLDEPWTGLDELAHDLLQGVLATVSADGGIVLLSRHFHSIAPAVESVVYRIEAGQLTRELPSPVSHHALMRVNLRRTAGAQDLPEPWHQESHMVTLTVPAHECDQLLQTALQRGWSVSAVHAERISANIHPHVNQEKQS